MCIFPGVATCVLRHGLMGADEMVLIDCETFEAGGAPRMERARVTSSFILVNGDT